MKLTLSILELNSADNKQHLVLFVPGKTAPNFMLTPNKILYMECQALLNPDIPCFANSVDPDQLASEEAN